MLQSKLYSGLQNILLPYITVIIYSLQQNTVPDPGSYQFELIYNTVEGATVPDWYPDKINVTFMKPGVWILWI